MKLPLLYMTILCWSYGKANKPELPLNDTSISKARTLLFDLPNPPCTPRIGKLLLTGFCDSYASCIVNNGRKIGFCPDSTNICCLVSIPCGGVVSSKSFYFLNPEFPATRTSTEQCSIKVRPYTKKYDQIRIDFNQLNLDPPDLSTGNCTDGYFQVIGSNPEFVLPLICGSNSNQHMYVNFNEAGFDLTLNIIRNPTSNFAARWLISVTQIETDSSTKVPEGCLQMFSGASGKNVRSFNFEGNNIHLANQFYDICLQRTAANCVFTWAMTTFAVSGIVENNPVMGEECLSDDYISILNGFTAANQRQNIYCGTLLPNVTSTYNRLRVSFNGEEPHAFVPQVNRGFNLKYFRTICPSS